MTTDLFEHLQNLKVQSDYKASGLDGIRIFWVLVDKGKDPLKLRKEDIKLDPEEYLNLPDPTDEQIEQARKNQEIYDNRDLCEEYLNWINRKIENFYLMTIPSVVFDLNSIFDEHILGDSRLKKFIKIDRQDFNLYCKILGNDHPRDFLSKLDKYEQINDGLYKVNKSNTAISVQPKIEPDRNPHPNIFKSLVGYQIFSEYCEKTSIMRHADVSYLYFKLRDEKFIDIYCGNDEFREWYNTHFEPKINSKLKSTGADTIERIKKLRDLIAKYRDLEKQRK